jgi:hypothetical protein
VPDDERRGLELVEERFQRPGVAFGSHGDGGWR